MTWSTPPILAGGDPLTAEAWNSVVGDLFVLGSYIPLYNVGGAAVNGPPPTPGLTPVYLFQGGSVSALPVPAGGAASLPFPQGFPGGVLSAWANPGNGAFTSIQIRPATSTAFELGLMFQPPNGSATTSTVQWGAIGW